jgi:hypothetical protein
MSQSQQSETKIWDSLIGIKDYIIKSLDDMATEIQEPGMERFNQDGWVNRVWENDYIRRAHIDVVDARESKKLWMMHCCIFPKLSSDAPIFGFDVIAGERKMTGAFLDFSPTVNHQHDMIKGLKTITDALEWKRERELPDWGKAIFSGGMLAAGNVQDAAEIQQVTSIAKTMFSQYTTSLSVFTQSDMWKKINDEGAVKSAQNRYAHYQKQNPHTPRVMKSLGLNEEDVDIFVKDILFPEIV